MGLYESTAADEYMHYVRPQEHGNHTGVRRLCIGKKLAFSSETEMECAVSRYSVETLTAATHTDELIPDGKTHVRVDYQVSGIGSASCGPALMEKYQLKEKNFTFQFTILPEC